MLENAILPLVRPYVHRTEENARAAFYVEATSTTQRRVFPPLRCTDDTPQRKAIGPANSVASIYAFVSTTVPTGCRTASIAMIMQQEGETRRAKYPAG
jgi:hypothetical protein